MSLTCAILMPVMKFTSPLGSTDWSALKILLGSLVRVTRTWELRRNMPRLQHIVRAVE